MGYFRMLLIGASTVLIVLCGVVACQSRRGQITDTWETANKTFKVRVRRYAEDNGGFVAGAYYVFESAPLGSENWAQIMTFRHDDPVEIPREQVRFVNDQIGYAFMVYKYAVTVDAGRTWFTWYAVKDLPDWRLTRPVIDNVEIDPDGKGIMMLTQLATRSKGAAVLRTLDYGRHWTEK